MSSTIDLCTLKNFHLMSKWDKSYQADDGNFYQKRSCLGCHLEELRRVLVRES